MNAIDEKLWVYIDGSCTSEEKSAISSLIADDPIYRNRYNDLLNFKVDLEAAELDEPGMAFTYNVMEAIRAEQALIPLKVTINRRVIGSIAAFFIITILMLLITGLCKIDWHNNNFKIPAVLSPSRISTYFSTSVIKAFLFFDTIMCLFFIDYYLRKKVHTN